MEREEIAPTALMGAITHYWEEIKASLVQAQKGIENNNFVLVRDTCIIARGYLDVISKYADKAITDMCVVTETAEYESPQNDETDISDLPQNEIVDVPQEEG